MLNSDTDAVAEYPKDILDYYRVNGKFPDEFQLDPGFVCAINGQRYFIHARATLPLHAFTRGVGFGLWVEVTREVFFAYMQAVEDDALYKDFTFTGTLANEWPGFENMKGARVTVRTVKLDEKVYITEVFDRKDSLFEAAALTQGDDSAQIERIRELVSAYVQDSGYNQPL